MTVFEISSVPQQPRKLTRCVLQITTLLDLYQAELARVPGMRCGDIGLLASGRQCLQPATASWTRAEDFVRFYPLLFGRMQGDGVAMRHWLRWKTQRSVEYRTACGWTRIACLGCSNTCDVLVPDMITCMMFSSME